MDNRKREIIEMLEREEQVGVTALASRFGVSEMTIRRDLDELQRQGLAIRTHGGAVPAGRLRFLQVGLPNYEPTSAKQAIGAVAANMVKPGQTVVFDTGTTALEVARRIPRDMDITVATTSLLVAQEFYGTDMRVLLLGGFIRKEFPSVYGPLTERLLNDIRVDILFIGCDGADSTDGFYSNDLHVSSLEQKMVSIAGKVVVVTESGKFGRSAFGRFASIEQVRTVVTDDHLPTADIQNLRDRNVELVIVAT